MLNLNVYYIFNLLSFTVSHIPIYNPNIWLPGGVSIQRGVSLTLQHIWLVYSSKVNLYVVHVFWYFLHQIFRSTFFIEQLAINCEYEIFLANKSSQMYKLNIQQKVQCKSALTYLNRNKQ